ncbi:formate dehydrogenase accessory sulfurtransferase FdhD [Nostocoides jenkinsii]|uniref:Sulfur carrier protein FdhD n=1 Tax=Nostocoides jenkinsii Ben 74 TaxID=1193518 RepID=A0A077MCG9_9MICO|nr:formate dehydrogenase accessory sulfurtransferase FdhD [Tetrasphaera jenkinsii]CCI54304.1 Protein fdhD homolog [Tetrasphaera jenkinsii Ben 74]
MTVRVPVERLHTSNGAIMRTRRPDVLAVEEPLEIRAAGQVITVTMRTPGADLDLVHGYLLAEGIIDAADQVRGARYCAGAVATGPEGVEQNTYNVLDVDLLDPARVPTGVSRVTMSTSACGVCGSASIDAISARVPTHLGRGEVRVAADVVLTLAGALRERQSVFEKTGGLHAAAVADVTGHIHTHAEDVGRHNAVDKTIGAALRAGSLPREDAILVVTSRASFEIVQKAAMAGIAIVATVSAPSSLAVETAATLGMTLIAFARGDRCNVYSGFERVTD